MQLEEIQHSIELRRNRIFLLMEEVRRLRIQQRVKVTLAASPPDTALHYSINSAYCGEGWCLAIYGKVEHTCTRGFPAHPT